jgi:polyhydroxyalkanoate synthesis regulator phasin
MNGNQEKFSEIQKEILNTMRNIFLTGMGAFTVMQDQTEKLMRMLADKGAETQQASSKVMEEWISNFRRAQDEFRKMVEENFKRAEDFVNKPK